MSACWCLFRLFHGRMRKLLSKAVDLRSSVAEEDLQRGEKYLLTVSFVQAILDWKGQTGQKLGSSSHTGASGKQALGDEEALNHHFLSGKASRTEGRKRCQQQ